MNTRDYSGDLARQLEFIRRSSHAFDQGFTDEAIRIATVIRVLMHDTKSSTSLLSYLKAGTLPILSTVMPVSDRAVFFDGMSTLTATQQAMSIEPGLDRGQIKIFCDRGDWWNQLVYVNGTTKIRRRDVVLVAANKDGGAHIDPALTPEYDRLKRGLWSTWRNGSDQLVADSQFTFLRQMAHELLNSPALIDLAETGAIRPANSQATKLVAPGAPEPDPSTVEKISISEVNRLRFVVSKDHFQLLGNLFFSSPSSATNPLGNYQVAQQNGYKRTLDDWLAPLLLEQLIARSPTNPELYCSTPRGRGFVARIKEIGH